MKHGEITTSPMRRPPYSFLLLLLLLLLPQSEGKSDFCSQSRGEQLYSSPLVLLARVKEVQEQGQGLTLTVKVGQVWSNRTGVSLQPRQRVRVRVEERCRRVRQGDKVVLTLALTPGGWEAQGPPLAPSAKVQRLRRALLCGNCTAQPVIKQIQRQYSVTASKWRTLPCRMVQGGHLKVTFTWWSRGREVVAGRRFRLKSRRKGSVLNVKGSSHTAGLYTCTASSVAGSTNMSTTLYVHGSSANSVCRASYCLHSGSCSVAVVSPGEHQPVCSCTSGYTGARCELKHLSTSFPGTLMLTGVVVTVVTLASLVSTWWIIRRMARVEARLLARHKSLQTRPKLRLGNGLNNNCKDVHTGANGINTGGNNVHTGGNSHKTGCNGLNTSGKGHTTVENGLISGGTGRNTSGNNVLTGGTDVHTGGNDDHTGGKDDHTGGNDVHTINQTCPPLLVNQISSSQSSGLSNGSVKTRRPLAPCGLTLATTPLANREPHQLLSVVAPSPSPSPLYTEPWDSQWNKCVHGIHGEKLCQVCQTEAELIVEECDRWTNTL